MSSPCCLCVTLIFVKKRMRSPCCLSQQFLLRGLWYHIAVCGFPIVTRQRAFASYYYVVSLFVCVYVAPNPLVFCLVRVVSKKSRRLVLPRTSSILIYCIGFLKTHILTHATDMCGTAGSKNLKCNTKHLKLWISVMNSKVREGTAWISKRGKALSFVTDKPQAIHSYRKLNVALRTMQEGKPAQPLESWSNRGSRVAKCCITENQPPKSSRELM
jgi:hypothetical protein